MDGMLESSWAYGDAMHVTLKSVAMAPTATGTLAFVESAQV